MIAEWSAWRVASFNAQDLANTAWAFAKLGILNEELMDAIAKWSRNTP